MKKLLFLLLPFLMALQPISPLTPVYSAGNNIILQAGQTPTGEEVIFTYWETATPFAKVKHCSIALWSDFKQWILIKRTVTDAVFSTPSVLWEWTTIQPKNINPWCIQ